MHLPVKCVSSFLSSAQLPSIVASLRVRHGGSLVSGKAGCCGRPTIWSNCVYRLISPQLPIKSCVFAGQIWRQPSQWKGWLLWASNEKAQPESFKALLQLPLTVLREGLASLPSGERVRGTLAAYAVSPANRVTVLPEMLRYLQQPLLQPPQ